MDVVHQLALCELTESLIERLQLCASTNNCASACCSDTLSARTPSTRASASARQIVQTSRGAVMGTSEVRTLILVGL